MLSRQIFHNSNVSISVVLALLTTSAALGASPRAKSVDSRAPNGDAARARIDSHGFRDVRVFAPLNGEVSGVVILLKPASFGDESYAMSQRFSDEGFLVIDLDPVRFSLPTADRQCKEFSDCLVALSAKVQKMKSLHENFLPSVVSLGQSGEFAELSWREAPQSAFNAVVSIDYCPRAKSAPKLMGDHHTKWTILESPARDSKCESLSSGLIALMDIERETIANVPMFRPGRMIRSVKQHLTKANEGDARRPAAISRGSVDDLQVDDLQTVLVEPDKSGHYDTFVILYSGDGGWAEFTDELAAEFSQKKIPVVGINSMRYFWKAKLPERGAADLARLIRFYKEKWGAKTVHLVGFSFGAGTLPFFVRRLPPDLKSSIGRVALLAPYRKAGFEFFLSDWLFDDDRGLEVLPEVRAMGVSSKLFCIYPAREKKVSLCTQTDARAKDLVAVELPGGHHFDGATAKIVDVFLGSPKKETK